MALKSLVVFVDPSAAGEARVRYAVRLAMQHEAHLIGVFIVPTAWENDRADCFIRGGGAIREMVERHNAAERDVAGGRGQEIRGAGRRDSYSFEFRVIRDGDTNDLARLHCLHADLVVVGHPRRAACRPDWSPERMLLSTGRSDPDRASGVAARARRDQRAVRLECQPRSAARDHQFAADPDGGASVSVVVVDAAKNAQHGQEPGADIAHFLSRHASRRRSSCCTRRACRSPR